MLKEITLLILVVTQASCQLTTKSMLQGEINKSVTMPCRLQVNRMWFVMQWSKITSKGTENIFTLTSSEVVFNLGKDEELYYDVIASENDTYVKFDLVMKDLRCNDGGIYTCSVIGASNLNSTTNLTITVPSKNPHTETNGEIVTENTTFPLKCEADVGFPNARIYWYKKEPDDSAFDKVDVQPSQALTKLGDCQWNASSTLEVKITKQQSGTTYRCAVQSLSESSYNEKNADVVFEIIEENITTDANIVVECKDEVCKIEELEDKDPNGSTNRRCNYVLLASTILFFKALILSMYF